MEETELSSEYLDLEITESNAMQNVEVTASTLQILKEMGVQLSVDDFGAGYSSLGYLKRFPVDRLKIDQSFVHNIPADNDDAAITTAMVALAHGLKKKVIAEGVENEDQMDFLRLIHCDEVQGFLLGHPLPAEQVAKIMM